MMQSDMWQDVRYNGLTLEDIRQTYIREGYSELSSAKTKKRILHRFNTDEYVAILPEPICPPHKPRASDSLGLCLCMTIPLSARRRLIFGDDEGSSDYGSQAAANDEADEDGDEESADVDAMQVVDEEEDEEDGGSHAKHKAKAGQSHSKEKRVKSAKRKAPSSHEEEEDDEEEEQPEQPAKKKAKYEKRKQKESESSVDDAFFVDSLVSSSAPPQSPSLRPEQQNTLPTSASQPKQSPGSSSPSKKQSQAPNTKDKKLGRPASLELLPSSLSNVGTGDDEDEDILGDGTF